MKQIRRKAVRARMIFAVAAAVMFTVVNAGAEDQTKMQQMDPKTHREFMPAHAKLMEEQKHQDAEIEKLLAEVNAATGERRVDALVAVVNKLVEQRKQMQAKIAARLDR